MVTIWNYSTSIAGLLSSKPGSGAASVGGPHGSAAKLAFVC